LPKGEFYFTRTSCIDRQSTYAARCLASYTTGPSFVGMNVGWMIFPAAIPNGSMNRKA
jgi:hypothetical protein